MDFIWVIALAALGAAMVLKPEFLWKIEHVLTVKNGEPSDLYLTLMRVGGVFFLLAAVGVGVYALVSA